MKEAACKHIEAIADTAGSCYKGLKKSWKECSKDVRCFARSLSEFLDVEDVLKSVHRGRHPEDEAAKKRSIIHEPIDWSKHPPCAQWRVHSSVIRQDETNNLKEGINKESISKEEREIEKKKYQKIGSVLDADYRNPRYRDSEYHVNAIRKNEKVSKEKAKSKQKYMERSNTCSHKRRSTINEQKIYFQPSWEVNEIISSTRLRFSRNPNYSRNNLNNNKRHNEYSKHEKSKIPTSHSRYLTYKEKRSSYDIGVNTSERRYRRTDYQRDSV